ncbi:uncharacterized protein LOC143916050 isoform X2 [Arctopsyche grandis]|uniref:uncharacterized protein LOC143916050 isoform X2 n=1 Tax=Arctopsyche grandis TaxID=121162 RepID=UPI00406D6EDC
MCAAESSATAPLPVAETTSASAEAPLRVLKLKKRGIIYLSSIPPLMTVAKVRDVFGQYGELGRVYLQLPKNPDTQKKRKSRLNFTEGWVEFESKRIAKKVSEMLNNQRIGTRKKSRYYDMVWNIKYLPRFKWVHLSERLAYERAVYKQRLRAEIAQAKKEATYFQENVEKSQKKRKKGTANTK